jgi:hypothetical protein
MVCHTSNLKQSCRPMQVLIQPTITGAALSQCDWVVCWRGGGVEEGVTLRNST